MPYIRTNRQVKGKEILQQALTNAHDSLLKAVRQEINERLVQAVIILLHRLFHQRREGLGLWLEEQGQCQRCKSKAVRDFKCDGYRSRTLLTPLGWIEFHLPRVSCRCGGSVTLNLEGLVRPYQRISDVVDAQIKRWYRLEMSLRQIQKELAAPYIGLLGLRILLLRIQQDVPSSSTDNFYWVPGRGL